MKAKHLVTDSSYNLVSLLMHLWHHLSKRRHRQCILLLGLMFLGGFTEMLSLGAVLPFLAIIADPGRAFHHPVIASIARAISVSSADQLVLPLTIAFVFAALMAGFVRLLLLWVNIRLSYAIGLDISTKIYQRTLHQPYQVHVMRNSSEVISAIVSKTGQATNVFKMFLMLINSTLMVAFVMFTLIAINPWVSMAAILSFGISYAVIVGLTRHRLKNISHRLSSESTKQLQILQEGLGSIRDVLLDGLQQVYCNRYRQVNMSLFRARGDNQIIAASPSFLMEMFGMSVIATLAYVLSSHDGGMMGSLPLLGVIAFGAQKLLPSIQKIYMAWAAVASSRDSLVDVLEMLDQQIPQEALEQAPEPLRFQTSICFDKVKFRYTEDGPWVLDDINLCLNKGARIGFVGSTGSGKSTMIDLLMGLLQPTRGRVTVDGQELKGGYLRAWHQTIAHVPQDVYLIDQSLAENIAFGLAPEDIDMNLVRKAAQQAQLDDFIEGMKDGYRTAVGERGIRLSGGQRQRIGIARALYKHATVLVFDEATSALDTVTERAVMEAIDGLQRELTVFLIAHRLTTVKNCDTIVVLEDGKIMAQGSYDQLIRTNPVFQKLAHQSA